MFLIVVVIIYFVRNDFSDLVDKFIYGLSTRANKILRNKLKNN